MTTKVIDSFFPLFSNKHGEINFVMRWAIRNSVQSTDEKLSILLIQHLQITDHGFSMMIESTDWWWHTLIALP